jgi:gliding motility-associated protein GldM
MAGGKLTPRQKMINMMYLVLTALLALNVSQEVLNAFKIVNDGLKTSNSSLKGKNELIYEQFAAQAADVPKAKELYPIAMEVKQISKQIFDDIEQYKKQIIDGSKGINPESGDIVQRDNIDVTTRIFVENGGKKGKDLYKKLADARAKFMKILADNKLSNVPISLNPDDVLKGKKKDVVSKGWEFAAFNHVPSTAAVTILSKFQNDVIASEGAVIDELFKGITAKSF